MKISPLRPQARAFTLIELLVVILILASVAGLVISRIDWVQASAEASTSAAGMAQVQNNLQIYRTNKKEFPNGWDSLIVDPAGTPTVLPSVFGETLPSTAVNWLDVTTFPNITAGDPTQNPVYSLTKVGINSVFDHDNGDVPNTNATTLRASTSIPGTSVSAFDTDPDVFATVDLTGPVGSRLAQTLYPQLTAGTLPTGVTALVALGVGPTCSVVGSTMTSAPISTATDPNVLYSRFIAIFAVYDNGRSAQLKAVVDSTGSVVGDKLEAYYGATPE